MWDAAAGAEVAVYCASLEEAKVCMDRKEVYGILEIPADFSKNINRGVQAHVALYCNMGALLNYKALAQAASDVSLAMGKEIQMKRLDYASWIEQEIAVSPVKIAEVKLFNPQGGFTSFIMPAVLILVIQQSLLLGVATLAGIRRDRYGKMIPRNRHYRQAWKIVLGKAVLYLPVYLVMGYWYVLFVPVFPLPYSNCRKSGINAVFISFFAGLCFYGSGSFFPEQRERISFFTFVFTSVPLMFISGISWPKEGIAWYWVAFSKVFPSTHGIDGFVKMNNMGATLKDVLPEYASLWILAVIYFVLACFLYRREMKFSV